MRPLDNNYRLPALRIVVGILVLVLVLGGSAGAATNLDMDVTHSALLALFGLSYRMDGTLPNISITYPTNGHTFTTSIITIIGTASDNIAMSQVKVKVGTGNWQLASGTTLWNRSVTLASGNNTIYAKAIDTFGNSRQTSVNVTYTPYQYIHTLNNSNGDNDPYSAGIALTDTVTSSTGIFEGYNMRFEWKYMDPGNPPERIAFYLMLGNKYIDSFTPTKAGNWKIKALEYITNNSCNDDNYNSDYCRRSEHPFSVIQMPEFGSLGFAVPLFLAGLLYISLRKRML